VLHGKTVPSAAVLLLRRIVRSRVPGTTSCAIDTCRLTPKPNRSSNVRAAACCWVAGEAGVHACTRKFLTILNATLQPKGVDRRLTVKTVTQQNFINMTIQLHPYYRRCNHSRLSMTRLGNLLDHARLLHRTILIALHVLLTDLSEVPGHYPMTVHRSLICSVWGRFITFLANSCA